MAFPGSCWTTLKSVYLRITLSRFTLSFFLFIFIHCFAEGFIQAFIFTQDATANTAVTSILHQAHGPSTNFGILTRKNGNATLSLCNNLRPDLPIDDQPCAPVFQLGVPNLPVPSDFNLTSNLFLEGVSPIKNGTGVNVELDNGNTIQLTEMCTLILTYPHQVLINAEREDVVLLITQFWIFCVSFFGIAFDSIPHLVAGLCFRVLATAWSAYIMWRTQDIKKRFELLLVSSSSPCHLSDPDTLFPGYFASREALQIPDLGLNVVALLLAIYLSRKLIKVYGPNTFNRVGAPKAIIRIYKYFLAVFVSFQLSALLLISAVGLWLDQMMDPNNAISHFTYHKNLYVALSIFTLAVLIPWITAGWYAVRREWKHLMLAFLVVAALVFTSWVVMIKSWSFAWTFVQWPFFGASIVAASLALMSTIIFGVISYLHFDKGLAHYLYVENVLAKSGFEPELFEKDVEKGTDDWREIGLDPMPTYTLSFSSTESDQQDPK